MRLVALFLTVLVGAACVETPSSDNDQTAGHETLISTIKQLTAPELSGRAAGKPGEQRAADLVAGWLGALPGARISRQVVPLPAEDGGGESVNVICALPGSGDLAGRWLVVGAHIDHLGRVDPDGTGRPEPGAYYPGAGDNASGVAAVRLAVETIAAAWPADAGARPRRSLLVCGFGAEEIGLVGSRHFVANLPVAADKIDAMVNLDAVGYLRDGPLHVAGAETSPVFRPLLREAVGDLRWSAHDPLLLRSDHVSFVDAGIASLFLFTGAYPEMNSPADSLTAVDIAGLATVAEVAARLVSALGEMAECCAFVQPTERERPAGGNRMTWFGSAPDFSGGDVEGYGIGAVAEGGPAAHAGLRQGDLLVSFAGRPVSDLMTFTQALRARDPGDVVEVEVLRDGHRLDFLVTLGDRSQHGR